MGKLVLIRHGQSQWNLEKRFTGWIDVPLSRYGREEAREAGRLVRHIAFDVAFTSRLMRAVETLLLVLGESNSPKTAVFISGEKDQGGVYRPDPEQEIPVYCVSDLNERSFGELQGLSKAEAAKIWGTEQVQIWRKSYECSPPGGESLKDTVDRVGPFFMEQVFPYLRKGKHVLLAAHGTSLRAVLMILKGLSPEEVEALEIPTGTLIQFEIEPQEGLLPNRADEALSPLLPLEDRDLVLSKLLKITPVG